MEIKESKEFKEIPLPLRLVESRHYPSFRPQTPPTVQGPAALTKCHNDPPCKPPIGKHVFGPKHDNFRSLRAKRILCFAGSGRSRRRMSIPPCGGGRGQPEEWGRKQDTSKWGVPPARGPCLSLQSTPRGKGTHLPCRAPTPRTENPYTLQSTHIPCRAPTPRAENPPPLPASETRGMLCMRQTSAEPAPSTHSTFISSPL